jgi:threonylcarbamoyladenosine tRNA methylthiotransferase MtaB
MKNLEKMCNHLHISLQSGSKKTLRAMNRKYSPQEYFETISRLRKNIENLSVTTDIIVGFPGETEEDFWESYYFCEKIKFSKIHVFPFSPKKGTKAFDMPNRVPLVEKNRRAKIFLELSARLETEFLNAQIGRTESVLFERDGSGFAKNYARVKAIGAAPCAGSILNADILAADRFSLFGKL